MKITRSIACLLAAAALGTVSPTNGRAMAATGKRKPAAPPTTCNISSIDNSTAKHTVAVRPAGITADDDWESPVLYKAVCDNKSVDISLRSAKTALKFTPGLTAAALKSGNAQGKVAGKGTLGFVYQKIEGLTKVEWNYQLTGGTFSCGSGTCEIRAKLTKPGTNQTIGHFVGTLTPGGTNPPGASLSYKLSDLIVSS